MPSSGWVIGCKGLRNPFRDTMFVGGREPKPNQWRFHGLLRRERGQTHCFVKILRTLQVSTFSQLEWAMSCLVISDMWPLGVISGSVILGGCWLRGCVACALSGTQELRQKNMQVVSNGQSADVLKFSAALSAKMGTKTGQRYQNASQ